jgi:O-antigen ligase
MAVALFVFLLLCDLVLLHGRLRVIRHVLVAGLALAAVPWFLRHRRWAVRTVLLPPMGFFAAFLAAALALSPFALAPADAARHALAFAGVMLFAVAAAQTVPLALTLALVRLALAAKLIGSLIIGLFAGHFAGSALVGSASSSLLERHVFGGLFGNPNPLCDTAAAYLLLAVCHIIERGREWPQGSRGHLQMAWYACTIPISAYLMWQSLSRSAWVGLAIVVPVLGILAIWRRTRATLSRNRRALVAGGLGLAGLIAIPVLLIWININRGVATPTLTLADQVRQSITSGSILDTSERPLYWNFALARIRERPWTGYGMSATSTLYTQLLGPVKEHAHNLELEAALYTGIPAALMIVLFVVSSLRVAAGSFSAGRPHALSVAAILLLLYILAQVEPVVFGSPYPSLLIVLTLATYLQATSAHPVAIEPSP